MTLRLNLGCGDKMIDHPEWMNIDNRKVAPESSIFVRHDIRHVRHNIARDGAVDEIMLSDVLEHFRLDDAKALLADCYALLKPGGKCTIKTPVIGLLIRWAKNHTEWETAMRWYGGNDYPGNCHQFCWPENELLEYINGLGFKVVKKGYQEDTNLVLEVVK